MSRRIDDNTLEKFKEDVNALRSMYTDANIAAIMKTNPGNFSSRMNGSKRPGRDFVDRFYQAWGKRLKEIKEEEGYLSDERMISELKEPPGDFVYSSSRYLLTEQAERLQRMEESLSRLNTTVGDLMGRLMESHQKLMESNQKLIDAHLLFFGQQAEKSGGLSLEK